MRCTIGLEERSRCPQGGSPRTRGPLDHDDASTPLLTNIHSLFLFIDHLPASHRILHLREILRIRGRIGIQHD
jgi:hypothetical protein